MKVIFITREGERLAGARIRCYNFAGELARLGAETRVLSFADTFGAKDGEHESEMSFGEKIGLNIKALYELSREKDAIFCIQRFNYHAFAPYLIHLFKGNRMIFDLDDWEMREDPGYRAYHFTRLIAKRSIFCIAASHYLKDLLNAFNNKVAYIPSGVDTELFKPAARDEKKEELVFSWAGTFNKREHVDNIRLALECFAHLKKRYGFIRLEIAGAGTFSREIKDMVEQSKDPAIHVNGWIPPRQMPDHLAGIHVGLHPVAGDSKFNRSKSPAKLFEYMAMEKPTVSTATGEALHIIRDSRNGFLAQTREEFIEKMRLLIENPDLRRQLGQEARRCAEENYSLKVLGERFYEALRDSF